MKNYLKAALWLVCLFLFVNVKAVPKAKRVVMIALDGISVQGFEQAHMPHLDSLLAEGVLSLETRNVMPSVTLPNWTSHLTGSGPEQHGVVNNGWEKSKKPNLPPVCKDEDGYYPSVFKVLKDENPEVKTAFYYNWKNLIYPYNKKCFDEVSFLEDDMYVENYDKAFDFLLKNREEPTVIFLYSVHTDHIGHKYAWMSPEYICSLEEVDKEIGRFITKMKKAELYESTHFMFLTDHGGIKHGHGGVSVQEMIVPWGIVGPGIARGKKIFEPNNTVNTASVILKLFRVKQPSCWIGKVPEFIFK